MTTIFLILILWYLPLPLALQITATVLLSLWFCGKVFCYMAKMLYLSKED